MCKSLKSTFFLECAEWALLIFEETNKLYTGIWPHNPCLLCCILILMVQRDVCTIFFYSDTEIQSCGDKGIAKILRCSDFRSGSSKVCSTFYNLIFYLELRKYCFAQESALMNNFSDKCATPWVGSIARQVNEMSWEAAWEGVSSIVWLGWFS